MRLLDPSRPIPGSATTGPPRAFARKRRAATGKRAAASRRLSSLRPERALGLAGNRREAAEHELLDALAFVSLRRVDVALRVDGDAVHAEELPGLPAAVAEARQDPHCLAIDDVDALVQAVGEVDVGLARIVRERDVPDRARAARLGRDAQLVDEHAVLAEHLNAIVDAIAHVDEAVARRFRAVHGIPELLRR